MAKALMSIVCTESKHNFSQLPGQVSPTVDCQRYQKKISHNSSSGLLVLFHHSPMTCISWNDLDGLY